MVVIGVASLAIMMFHNFFNVTTRYLFNTPVPITVELSQLLMVFLVFSFLSYAERNDLHIRCDIILVYLPEKIRRYFNAFAFILGAIFSGILAWGTFFLAQESVIKREISESTTIEIPIYEAKVFIFICFFSLMVIFLVNAVSALFKRGSETLLEDEQKVDK